MTDPFCVPVFYAPVAAFVQRGPQHWKCFSRKGAIQSQSPSSKSWNMLHTRLDIYNFLSDPSPIICYACHSLTHSLTNFCLVNLIDVTLACEDANSKLVELLMWMMWIVLATVCFRFGSPGLVITLTFCSDFEHFCQDFEVEVRRDFEAEVWSVFCCWCFVEVTKLNLGQD